MSDRKVQGFCPMGCGQTLFLASGGYVTCGYLSCPNPTAAHAALLDERETEHIIRFDAAGFSIQHPLRERLHGELFDCGLHAHLSAQDGPPPQHGRYRVTPTADGSRHIWEKLRDPESQP